MNSYAMEIADEADLQSEEGALTWYLALLVTTVIGLKKKPFLLCGASSDASILNGSISGGGKSRKWSRFVVEGRHRNRKMVSVSEAVDISQGVGVKTATAIVCMLRSLWPWMRVPCSWVLSVRGFVFAFVELDAR